MPFQYKFHSHLCSLGRKTAQNHINRGNSTINLRGSYLISTIYDFFIVFEFYFFWCKRMKWQPKNSSWGLVKLIFISYLFYDCAEGSRGNFFFYVLWMERINKFVKETAITSDCGRINSNISVYSGLQTMILLRFISLLSAWRWTGGFNQCVTVEILLLYLRSFAVVAFSCRSSNNGGLIFIAYRRREVKVKVFIQFFFPSSAQ